MKRHPGTLIISLALASTPSFAREPQAPPSPSSPQVGTVKEVPNPTGYGATSFFVGHYGEAIEFPYYWTPRAELRGEAEAVYFHRKFSDNKNLQPFQPKNADYKLENFARLELMELVVILKNAPGGLRSLKAIRLTKEKEIAKKGTDSKIIEETNEYAWPQGTFHVRTTQPYRTVQTYSESPKEFYIFTTGGYLAAGDFGFSEKRASDYNYATERALESLRKHLLSVHEKNTEGHLSSVTPDMSNFFSFVPVPDMSKDFLSSFKTIRFFGVYGTLSAGMLLLAFWPGTTARARRVRLCGWSLLFFSHLNALLVFLSLYIPIRFSGIMWRNSDDATLIPALLTPWISWLCARRLGSARTKRVAVSTGVISALWTIMVLLDRRPGDSLPAQYGLFGNTVILHLIGMISGAAFALAFGPRPQKQETR